MLLAFFKEKCQKFLVIPIQTAYLLPIPLNVFQKIQTGEN